MLRFLALLWLILVTAAGAYLAHRLHDGLTFRTDLMALLPREERNPLLQQANDTVTTALSRQIMVLVGHPERLQARAAATEISRALSDSGLVDITTSGFDKDRLRRMGALYFPYRRGLLADGDRQRLVEGRAAEIATRALSQVYGFVGMADAGLLRNDPYLLMSGFFTSLPLPLSALSLDDGMLTRQDGGTTWILVAARLTGEPFALDVQKQLSEALDPAAARLEAAHPGLAVLRLGAVFYAKAGAEQAMNETSAIGIASTLGTVLLVLAAFRALTPLWLSLLVIGVGVVTALAASLWAFGELHVGALLFGVSLIGVAVDYSLQYCSEGFAPGTAPPASRLRRVLMGISLGTATTVIGYLTLFLAPFPGLHQIAAFSAVGLVAAWLTVVLWLPRLDRTAPPRHGRRMLAWSQGVLSFWENPSDRRRRIGLLALLGGLALLGLPRLHADDDVRRMQSLSAALTAQQDRILQVIGRAGSGQFFLIQAPDDETALQREEALMERLRPLAARGALGGFQALAQFVPSAARQRENRALVHRHLDGAMLAEQVRRLALAEPPPPADDAGPVLTLREALDGPLGFLSMLTLGGSHVVTLESVSRLDEVAHAADGLEGVRFVDPTGNFSALLGKYRNRALILIALSAALMAPLLIGRYGPRGSLWVMLPPALAVALTPALRALAGGAFTFFDAMALVLVLSIGVDYAVFLAETEGERKPVTLLAVSLAACTALLSFGLLTLSSVLAVRHFGSTMAVGILLAYLLAPLARRAERETRRTGGHWAGLAERGPLWGMRLIKAVYGLMGRRGCMILLWLIVPYFYLSEADRRRGSLAFLARAGLPAPTWRDGLRHYLSFATKALETFISWADPEHIGAVAVIGAEPLLDMTAEGRGGLLLVSHLGNAELCRARLTALFGREITVLLHTRHAAHYNRILKSVRPDVTDHTIQVTEIGPETAIDLRERVERGEWIAIAADRTPVLSRGRISRVPFLGQPAAFSQGPHILAALMGCPVYLMFCLRDRAGHTVTFEPFAERIDLPRRDRAEHLDRLAARYAARLEHYTRQAPLQWYNFFDFWA